MATDNSSQPLFTEVRMVNLKLRNRIVMAPLIELFVDGGRAQI